MSASTWAAKIRAMDVRILAAIGAGILLIAGVMWTVPFAPDSNNFILETARRDISNARVIEIDKEVKGDIVDGSDADFYRINGTASSVRFDLRMTNGSEKLIPALIIYDSSKNLVIDKSAEYVRQPGASIDASFLAQSNMTYYVRVASQRNTTGSYRLRVSIRNP